MSDNKQSLDVTDLFFNIKYHLHKITDDLGNAAYLEYEDTSETGDMTIQFKDKDGEYIYPLPAVVDNLTSTSTQSALSANQGKVLNDKIPNVIDNLNSTSATSALSAKQGKTIMDTAILDKFYPIGTIYETKNASFNPNTAWGGTWVKIEGKFLLGSSSSHAINTTGGEENVTLTLNNYQYGTWRSAAGSADDLASLFPGDSGGLGIRTRYTSNNNTAHNNMPPFVAVNIWERTA